MELGHHASDIGSHLCYGDILSQIIHADQQEYFGRLHFQQTTHAEKNPGCAISADAAVQDLRIIEHFLPFTTICDAVATENDSAFHIGKVLEMRDPLPVIGTGFLRKDRGTYES